MAFGDETQVATNKGFGTTVYLSLGSSPTAGNLGVAVLHSRSNSGTIDVLSGWTLAVRETESGDNDVCIQYRIFQSGDGTGYTFTDNDSGQKISGVLYEFDAGTNGFKSSPLDQTGSEPVDDGVTTRNTGTTGTLTQADQLVIAGAGIAAGSSSLSSPTIDSGFATVDYNDTTGSYQSVTLASHKTVSATTALNPSFSWTNSGNAIGVIATFMEDVAGGPSIVINRGLSNISAGIVVSGGGGHSGLHPVENGYIS